MEQLRTTPLSGLTRQSLEGALQDWAMTREGTIANEYITLLLSKGEVLDALHLVAKSMQDKKEQFRDDDSCLVWTAWMNYQEYGTPGFPLSSALR